MEESRFFLSKILLCALYQKVSSSLSLNFMRLVLDASTDYFSSIRGYAFFRYFNHLCNFVILQPLDRTRASFLFYFFEYVRSLFHNTSYKISVYQE